MLGFKDSDSQRGSRGSSRRSSRSNVSSMNNYLDDGRGSNSSRRRSSTGNNPGTVLDPEHDGRLHHGDQEFGLSGERLESYDEWVDSHRVPHPGAQGNQNAAGPHNIPSESMERIREGGGRGGEAHQGMRFERTDDGSNSRSSRSGSSKSSGSRSSKSSNNSNSNRSTSTKSGMSSRSTGKGMNTSKRRSSQSQKSNSQGSEGGLVRDLQEAREMANRLDEILSRIA